MSVSGTWSFEAGSRIAQAMLYHKASELFMKWFHNWDNAYRIEDVSAGQVEIERTLE